MKSTKHDPDRITRLPDPAILRQAATDRATDLALQHAYRLLAKKQYMSARKALHQIYLSDPQNPHAQNLQQRIRELEADESMCMEGLRTWRYRIGMNTAWRRLCWGAAGTSLGIYSIFQWAKAIPYARNYGLAASITTQIEYRGR